MEYSLVKKKVETIRNFSYRLEVVSKKRGLKGPVHEVLGIVNVKERELYIFIKKERLNYWLYKGLKINEKLYNEIVALNYINPC